jgi:hypothetical protein
MRKRTKKRQTMRATQSARRRAHFAAGGTPKMWRGGAVTFRDRKKEASRRQCRQNHTKTEGGAA